MKIKPMRGLLRAFTLWCVGLAASGAAPLRAAHLPNASLPGVFKEAGPDNQPCKGSLAPGQSCVAPVRAEAWFSDTGVRVDARQSYCFFVPPGQLWLDKNRRNSPPRGEPGSALMNTLAWAKRDKTPWFTLMAGIVPEPVPAITTRKWVRPGSRESAASLEMSGAHNVAEGGALETAMSGALVMYPNDAKGPPGRPGLFYENNSGQIWVRVSRPPAGEACVSPPGS